MMERRRKARLGALADGGNEDDIELGLNNDSSINNNKNGIGPQETGVTSLEHEVDNWDENAVDNWDTEDGPGPDEEADHSTTRK